MVLLLVNLTTLFAIICCCFIFITNANIYCFFLFDIQFLDILYLIIFILLFLGFMAKNVISTLLTILFSFVFFAIGLFSIFLYLPTLMFIIVYLGALMMLFIFVVMLFNVQQNKNLISFPKLFGFFVTSFVANNFAISLWEETKIYNLDTVKLDKDLWTQFFLNDFTLNGNNIFSFLFMPGFNISFIFLTFVLLTTLIVAITIIFLTKNSN